MRSSLHWGPGQGLDRYWLTTDVIRSELVVPFRCGPDSKADFFATPIAETRNYFNKEDNVFGLEWDPKGLYTWKGSRARSVLKTAFKKSFWSRGDFGVATAKGATYTNPWVNASTAAPFDQDFYLILNVAVGGTNGYFEDVAGKPWSNDGDAPAVHFHNNRAQWLPTWPEDPKERGMSIDYIKMWRIAEPGEQCQA